MNEKNSVASTDSQPSSSAAPANQLTNVKGLEKLWLFDNPDLAKAQIDQLQNALPKCKIDSNAKK